MHTLERSEQEVIRRQSLEELRELGIEPYPAHLYEVNAYSTDIKREFVDGEEPRAVSIAGRIMSRRIMGKASFFELMDSEGPYSGVHHPRRPLPGRGQRTVQHGFQEAVGYR